MAFKRIGVEEAQSLINDKDAVVIDIRDPQSFESGHINNATFIHDGNIADFIANADFDRPLIVCCYHGNMSQGAANYFNEQGFEESYSLDGGYAAWHSFISN